MSTARKLVAPQLLPCRKSSIFALLMERNTGEVSESPRAPIDLVVPG